MNFTITFSMHDIFLSVLLSISMALLHFKFYNKIALQLHDVLT